MVTAGTYWATDVPFELSDGCCGQPFCPGIPPKQTKMPPGGSPDPFGPIDSMSVVRRLVPTKAE